MLRNHSASSDDFIILTCENKKFLFQLKESLILMREYSISTIAPIRQTLGIRSLLELNLFLINATLF